MRWYSTQWLAMDFPERLSTLRKEKGFTQQSLADEVAIHVSQIRRYESGQTQPTLEVIRKLAIALGISADVLVFDRNERNPREELKRQFEALSQFDDEEIKIAKALLESLILKHNAKRAFVEG
jgi:transcriptional regulator with XRE-family HTH domain